MNNYPHLTVAVICRRNDEILMVNEIDNGINCWNQPAGHVEVAEGILEAAIREALEETQYEVALTGITGVYQGIHQQTGTHFVRICFLADIIAHHLKHPRDSDIVDVQWINLHDLLANKYTLRSELTRTCLEDLTKATIYPLSIVKAFSPRSHS